MPIPAGAGVIAAVVHCFQGSPIDNPWIAVVWLGLLLFTGFLMVSSWRFWSGKELSLSGRHPFRLLFVIALVTAIIVAFSEVALLVVALGYLVSGVLARLAYARGRSRRQMSLS